MELLDGLLILAGQEEGMASKIMCAAILHGNFLVAKTNIFPYKLAVMD